MTVATRKFFPEGRSDGDAISSAWPDADTAPVEEELTGPAVTNLCARAKAGDLPDGSLAISMHWVHATDGLRTADVLCTPDACGTDGEMRGGLLLLIQVITLQLQKVKTEARNATICTLISYKTVIIIE